MDFGLKKSGEGEVDGWGEEGGGGGTLYDYEVYGMHVKKN